MPYEGTYLKSFDGGETAHFLRRDKGTSEKQYEKDVAKFSGRSPGDALRNFGIDEGDVQEFSPEQLEVVRFAVQEANAVIGKYSDRDISLSVDSFTLVADDVFQHQLEQDGSIAGYAVNSFQTAFVNSSRMTSKSFLATTVFHEAMHLGSFLRSTSLENEDGERKLSPERMGFGVVVNSEDGDEEVREWKFVALDEAVVESLTHRFMSAFEDHDLFRDEFHALHQDHKNPHPRSVPTFPSGDRAAFAVSYEGLVEHFQYTLNEIYEANQDIFNSTDDVFDLFAHAVFKGRLLPVARLIDSLSEEASFRRLGDVQIEDLTRNFEDIEGNED